MDESVIGSLPISNSASSWCSFMEHSNFICGNLRFEPQQRAHFPQLAAGLASESENS